MSYRASVVKVPDYSSSSFSTEGFTVYKNVQTGQWHLCVQLCMGETNIQHPVLTLTKHIIILKVIPSIPILLLNAWKLDQEY